jgi:hypothetical protein
MRMLQTIRTSALARHVHKHAYAALVLSGCYEEAGDLGRLRVHAGDVVLHEAFEAHLDRFPASGAIVLNISLPAQYMFQSGLGRMDDSDAIVRIAEKNEAPARGAASFVDRNTRTGMSRLAGRPGSRFDARSSSELVVLE